MEIKTRITLGVIVLCVLVIVSIGGIVFCHSY